MKEMVREIFVVILLPATARNGKGDRDEHANGNDKE